jgi:sortase A
MRLAIRVTGEACLTAGIVVALFLAYLVSGTGPRAAQAQQQFATQLNRQWRVMPRLEGRSRWDHDRISVLTGQPFAFLRIPAFGAQWRFAIIEGTQLAQLNVSPGHVPGTQLPGQVGNFAVAGHRVTAGNPFWGLPALRPGDMVYVDTRYHTYGYRVTGRPTWVAPTDMAVLDPVPGNPGMRPHQRTITLITCDPAWTGAYRVIVTGVLVTVTDRPSGTPLPALPAQDSRVSSGKPGF